MAAGLGFKDFTTGEVLTAADVDGYLMQGIWVFANATARDAAVTSPQEGNACYLKDTDVIQVYTGSTWAAQSASNPISANIVDAKGDIIAATAADTVSRLAVGANNTILTADSTTATGLKWAAPAAAAFVGVNAIRDGASASITANTDFFVPLTTELYDTDGFHDNTTNNERLTIPTGKGGKYLLSATVRWSGATNTFLLNIYKNTSANLQTGLNNGLHRQANNAGGTPYINASIVTDLAAGDYVRVAITGNATGTDPLYCVFSATYLGA